MLIKVAVKQMCKVWLKPSLKGGGRFQTTQTMIGGVFQSPTLQNDGVVMRPPFCHCNKARRRGPHNCVVALETVTNVVRRKKSAACPHFSTSDPSSPFTQSYFCPGRVQHSKPSPLPISTSDTNTVEARKLKTSYKSNCVPRRTLFSPCAE